MIKKANEHDEQEEQDVGPGCNHAHERNCSLHCLEEKVLHENEKFSPIGLQAYLSTTMQSGESGRRSLGTTDFLLVSYDESAGADGLLNKRPQSDFNNEAVKLIPDLTCASNDRNLSHTALVPQKPRCPKPTSHLKSPKLGDLATEHSSVGFLSKASDSPVHKLASCNKVYNKEFTDLYNFLQFLFLRSNNGSVDVVLNFKEMSIVSAVVEKKLCFKLDIKNIYELEGLSALENYSRKRRAEECYKLVFKQVFKQLQIRFETQNADCLKSESQISRLLLFYKYYFGYTAIQNDLVLENFFLPLTVDSRDLDVSSLAAKTINSSYISLIVKSELFVAHFIEYGEQDFLADYASQAAKKIAKMVGKWESIHAKAFSSDKAVEIICDYIINNKKSKLPWFYKEVEYAVEFVKQMVLRQAIIAR